MVFAQGYGEFIMSFEDLMMRFGWTLEISLITGCPVSSYPILVINDTTIQTSDFVASGEAFALFRSSSA